MISCMHTCLYKCIHINHAFLTRKSCNAHVQICVCVGMYAPMHACTNALTRLASSHTNAPGQAHQASHAEENLATLEDRVSRLAELEARIRQLDAFEEQNQFDVGWGLPNAAGQVCWLCICSVCM